MKRAERHSRGRLTFVPYLPRMLAEALSGFCVLRRLPAYFSVLEAPRKRMAVLNEPPFFRRSESGVSYLAACRGDSASADAAAALA